MPIRLATPADARGIATVQVHAWQLAYVGIVPEPVLRDFTIEMRTGRWQDILTNQENKSCIWVYEDDSKILGWCRAGPCRDEGESSDTGELWAIYVSPNVQGKGVGKVLMENAVCALVEWGYRSAVLWVLTDNKSARAFYEKMGWQPDGHEKAISSGGEEIPETRYAISF